MQKKNIVQYMPILTIVLLTLACGSLQVGVVTPTTENKTIMVEETPEPVQDVVSIVDDEDQPTEKPAEDFSHLWVEYWSPVFNYGLALPSHWEVSTEDEGGFMITQSYDLDYFRANSMKGGWIGGEAPEGAVKLDFVPFEDIVPEQSLATAISNILGADPEMTVVLSVEEITLGNYDAVRTTTARPDDLEDIHSNIVIRLSPEVILFAAAYPNSAHNSSDVQTILSTLVLDKSTPITKPATAPHPPLTVKNENLSGMPTAIYPVAWYGHIASLAEGDLYDDKVVLLPLGAGELGIKGGTAEIEEQILSLRDATGEGEYVHLWGVLYCNIDDYNTCQLNVDRLEYGDQYTVATSPVDKWVGTIKSTTFNGEPAYAFELSGVVPVWYGIAAPKDLVIQDQIEALADSDTVVNVWGDLLVAVQDVNGTRIEVQRIDPPGPGALPSSAACESGYLGSAEEMLEFIQWNLETGNHWPFTYAIGNPFVIGFWQSEGVAIPREEAYRQLTESYLPSPEKVIVITNPAEFPDLYGMPLEEMWGPDVDVAANLYSKGWGPDGQGEAIIVVARCQAGTHDAYFWYGMLYAGIGFERNE